MLFFTFMEKAAAPRRQIPSPTCCDGYELIGVDYDVYLPWETPQLIRAAFTEAAAQYPAVSILANSIGAYFAMLGLFDCPVQKALFISPVLDMEKLIQTMMGWAQVTEQELCEREEIPTNFGETLSMRYPQLCAATSCPLGNPPPKFSMGSWIT